MIRRLRRVPGWALGHGEELAGRVVAVSVHLDDAVFSVGAALARATRRGADVTILTVLGGEPYSTTPAAEWDLAAGFTTAGEAVVARLAEDRTACRLVGARPVVLPYWDHRYEPRPDHDEVVAAVERSTAHADTVLVPGFPLMHEDHQWIARLLERPLGRGRVGRYVEQPYAALWTAGPTGDGWQTLAAGSLDRLAKLRAFRAYRSQLPLLDPRALRRTIRYEALAGGEAVQWR